jgi:two-component system cell cycle sensor histidine kinase/response regulator CckA
LLTNPKKILLADDEPSVRLLLERVLQSAGYQVVSVENGLEASEWATQHSEEIDVLISDVVMPDVGGVELAEMMRKIRPGTKVLLISGFVPEGLAFRAEWGFLQKPFSPVMLTEAVGSLLNAA